METENTDSMTPQELDELLEEESSFVDNDRQLETEEELKEEMRQLMRINAWLSKLFMNLLESMERPDGTKFLSSSPHMSGGQRKQAVLELLNHLLNSVGLPACPGALGELVYNDLCLPYLYNY